MIVPVIKEIVTTVNKLPFGHGRKPMLNLSDEGGPFVWLYPFVELDKVAVGIGTSYDCIIGFYIPGDTEPGTDVEQSYIDQARQYCYTFGKALAANDFVK